MFIFFILLSVGSQNSSFKAMIEEYFAKLNIWSRCVFATVKGIGKHTVSVQCLRKKWIYGENELFSWIFGIIGANQRWNAILASSVNNYEVSNQEASNKVKKLVEHCREWKSDESVHLPRIYSSTIYSLYKMFQQSLSGGVSRLPLYDSFSYYS